MKQWWTNLNLRVDAWFRKHELVIGTVGFVLVLAWLLFLLILAGTAGP